MPLRPIATNFRDERWVLGYSPSSSSLFLFALPLRSSSSPFFSAFSLFPNVALAFMPARRCGGFLGFAVSALSSRAEQPDSIFPRCILARRAAQCAFCVPCAFYRDRGTVAIGEVLPGSLGPFQFVGSGCPTLKNPATASNTARSYTPPAPPAPPHAHSTSAPSPAIL
jgi:hypothetical protein